MSQAGNQGPTGTTKKPMRRLQRWTQGFGADAAWRRFLEDNTLNDSSISVLADVSAIRWLRLSENKLQLRNISFPELKNLTFLHMDNNFIESIDGQTFSSLKSLRVLKLDNNPIKMLPKTVFDSVKNLQSFASSNIDFEDLTNHTVSFFCETMLLPKDSGKSFISDRTPFHVPASRATGGGRGRPSGGLQCYINPKIDAKLISSDFNHMCILLPFVTLIGIYFSPKTDIDDILIMLATFLNNAPPNTPILLGGDLNVNINSEEFQELNNFLSKGYNLSLISDPTTNSFYNYKKDGTLTSSRIDHVFCSRSVPVVKSAVFITNDCSDHRPDHIVLKFKRNNTSSSFTSSSSHSHIDIASAADFLSDPAFLAIPETQLVSRINSIFSSCSIQAPRRKKNSKPWFNAHSYDLRARCKLLSQSTNRQDYIIARKAYHHHLHHAKLIYEKNQESALINSALEKGLPALYKSAKAKTNGSTIPISRLHSYANKLFSSDSSYNTFMPIPSCDQNNHSLMSPFLLSELIKILKSVKSKAPSATGCLSPHTLKLLHLDIAPLLLRIFNYALSTGYFPECWLETVLFFLHKNGSKSDPSNYRTIAIENPFLKVFMLLINSRMTQYAESESLLPDFQFGFRPNRNCMSAVSILFEMSKARLVNHKRTYCAFMDFSKAFDKIDRNLLFQKLQLLGFPRNFCQLIFNILKNLNFRVRQDTLLSPPFKSKIGTPQGDPISPLLFSLYIADLPSSLAPASVNFPSDIPINCLLYADDTCLIADTADELQLSLDSLTEYCKINHLIINVSKSKVVVFHKGKITKNSRYLRDMEISNLAIRTFKETEKLKIIHFKKFRYCSFAPHVRICEPRTDGLSSTEHLLVKPILRVCVWVVAAVTCIGNFLVLLGRFLATHDEPGRMSMMFIKNLSFADLLMGIYLCVVASKDIMFRDNYMKYAHEWMSSHWCVCCGILAMTASEVSVLTLSFMSIERHFRIVNPFRVLELHQRSAYISMILIWGSGITLAIIPTIPWMHQRDRHNFYGNNGLCFPLHISDPFIPGWQYSAFIFFGINFMGVLIIAITYISMYISIQHTRSKTPQRTGELEVAKRFFLIILTNCLCWIPIIILKLLALTGVKISAFKDQHYLNYEISWPRDNMKFHEVSNLWYYMSLDDVINDLHAWIVIFILPVNSAMNPIIYTLSSKEFKKKVKTFANKSRLFWWLPSRRSTIRSERSMSSTRTMSTRTSSGFGSVRIVAKREMGVKLAAAGPRRHTTHIPAISEDFI
ncbi:Relaxin receptor 2 [Nymphon striatum]|nr:Relaxin receptor 2 [Nymphon striatum]